MQVIENMEENILSTLLTGKVVHVIHNDDVHGLVKIDKVVDGVVLQRVNKLLAELFARHIDNQLIGQVAFNLVADGLGQMGLTQPHTAIDHQWVERGAARLARHSKSRRAGQPVTFALDKIIKRIMLIQLRVYLKLFKSGYN